MHTNRSGARWPVSGQGGWHKGNSITPNQQTDLFREKSNKGKVRAGWRIRNKYTGDELRHV